MFYLSTYLSTGSNLQVDIFGSKGCAKNGRFFESARGKAR